MNSFFSTISFAQGILIPFGGLVVAAEAHWLPASDLRAALMTFTGILFAQLLSAFRKPSTEGGTVAKAVTISKDSSVGQPAIVLAPDPKKK